MSHQCLAEAFAPWEADSKAKVMVDTWGHLAPKKNKTYQARLVFAIGCFGDDNLNPMAICSEFGGLDDSPWLFDFIQDWLQSFKGETGCVYEFKGTFRNYKLLGETCLLLDTNT